MAKLGAERSAVDEVDALLDSMLDEHGADLPVIPGGERLRRGKTSGPIRVALPDGYRQRLDDLVVPDDDDVMALSGG